MLLHAGHVLVTESCALIIKSCALIIKSCALIIKSCALITKSCAWYSILAFYFFRSAASRHSKSLWKKSW